MNQIAQISHDRNDEPGCKMSHMALVALLCLVLYLAGNGSISLWDRDEAWYSQTAREMVERNDYIVPTFNGEPRYRKPILIYWLMAAAYSVLGDNEMGARFCSAVAGTVTCLVTYRLGTRMGGRTVGLVAALMLAVAPFMVIESKLATTDAVLTALLTAAMSCIWELHKTGPSWRWSLLFWCLIGMAVLAKGPFAAVFISMAMVAWFILCRDWSVLWRLNWAVGPALALAICLPWGVAIYLATHGQFYAVALGEQAFGHSFSAMNQHRGFPGYYVLLVLAGLLPWTFALPTAVSGIWHWARRVGAGSFLVGWVIGPMVMVEIMRTKLPQYYLAAFPAWALLIARGAVKYHESANHLAQSLSGKCRMLAFGALGCLGAGAATGVAIMKLPVQLLAPSLTATVILGGGTLISLVTFWRLHDRLGWCTVVGTWWLTGVVVGAWFLPSADSYRVARASAEALRAQAATGSTIVLFRFREPSLVFYVGRPLPTISSTKRLAEFIKGRETVWTLLRDADVHKLRSGGIAVDACRTIKTRQIEGWDLPAVFLARLSLAPASEAAALNTEVEPQPSRR